VCHINKISNKKSEQSESNKEDEKKCTKFKFTFSERCEKRKRNAGLFQSSLRAKEPIKKMPKESE